MSDDHAIQAEALRRHVVMLAGEIGERHLWRPQALARAARYLSAVWEALGLEVRAERYTVEGRECENLEVTLPGRGPQAGEIVLLGAHYDSVWGSPGANDNATGVAALLEIARVLAARPRQRTLRLVAFVNEEPPFFRTRRMGSYVYAHAARARGDDIRAMFSLETIGYYRTDPGTQRYPPCFDFFYPDRGDFVAFVSDWRSRRLLRAAVAAFRQASDFPLQQAAVPSFVPGVAWSDHLNFWRMGYAAVMVTDTAPYRYPYYHTPEDTPEKVDVEPFARVCTGLAGMTERLLDAERLP